MIDALNENLSTSGLILVLEHERRSTGEKGVAVVYSSRVTRLIHASGLCWFVGTLLGMGGGGCDPNRRGVDLDRLLVFSCNLIPAITYINKKNTLRITKGTAFAKSRGTGWLD